MNKPLKMIKGKIALFSIVVLFFYLFIAFNTPLTHDDWTWGTSDGWARLTNWFENYNGRYIGNLLEIYITRSDIGRILLMGIFSALIVLLSVKITKEDNIFFYIISFLAFLCVPNNMFAQTYAWAAGFSNYIPSIVLSLLFLYFSKGIFESHPPIYSKTITLLVIPLGFCSQLFVEHMTLYNIFTSLFIIAYAYFKFKRTYLFHILYLISTLAGALVMFTNGAYLAIIKGSDTYRTVNTASEQTPLVKKLFDIYTEQMYPLLFLNNVVLNILLSIFCIVVLMKNFEKLNRVISYLVLFILVSYPLYKPLILDSFNIRILGIYSNEFEAFFSVLFYISLLLIPLLYITDRDRKIKLSFYLISAIILAVPFFFVTPLGPRCFLASYTFFVLFLIEICIYIFNKQKVNLNYLTKPFLLWVIALVISYCYVFISIYTTNLQREESIRKQVKEESNVITISRLPFEHYLQVGTPNPSRYQGKTFKEFYNIPKDKVLKVITYEEWEKSHK